MSDTDHTAAEQAAAKAANDAQLAYPVDPHLAAIVERARTTGERPVITAADIVRARVESLDTATLVELLSTYRESGDAAALAVVDAALIARAYA